ncbi:MAG: Fic family protein [Elusimicrobiota bacterium]|jgi:Fic family protein|nr:Fic family protein [Elusimicrobiota bacterium]
MTNKPPFTITDKITNLVAKISGEIGKIQGAGEYNRNLHLRKINRLRSIQSSTAIEGNTLSLEQITDVINGKRILGNPREIREVKNAYEAYEKMPTFNPYSVKDFLSAHKMMTSNLVSEAGSFRKGNVGVFAGSKVVHLGANPQYIQGLVRDLFDWAKKADTHPLIKSCVMHFEIEFIHPFADGNGRMGRLWQSLVLAEWEPLFAWIPIETLVYEHQQEYYDALSTASNKADSTAFIEFMLTMIEQTLAELPKKKITDIIPDKITDKLGKADKEFLLKIIGWLENNDEIDNYRAQLLTNKSAEMIKKHFAALVDAGVLIAVGKNKGRKYKLATKK